MRALACEIQAEERITGPRLEPRRRLAETGIDSSRLLDDERADALMLSDDVDVSEAALERAC